jgi:tetratricopeptide (TPR) repeat protein
LAIQLDGLASDIGDLLQLVRQPRVSSYAVVNEVNSHAMVNLAACVSSAQRFVSAAISIVSTRRMVSDDGLSNILDFNDQRRNEINGWIPKPAIPEEVDHTDSDKTTGTTFDREYVNIQTLLKFATLAYNAQKYDEAMALLQKFRIRSEARYGPNFENRNELLGMLVTTHCRLEEWESAEEILGMDFDDKSEAVKTLVWCYFEDRRWSDAERILRRTIEFESASDTEIDEMLAEIYLGKGDYEKAIKSCDKILQTLGDDHIQFHMSVSLLTQIYEVKGDAIEAKIHRDLLPPGIEGYRLSENH